MKNRIKYQNSRKRETQIPTFWEFCQRRIGLSIRTVLIGLMRSNTSTSI